MTILFLIWLRQELYDCTFQLVSREKIRSPIYKHFYFFFINILKLLDVAGLKIQFRQMIWNVYLPILRFRWTDEWNTYFLLKSKLQILVAKVGVEVASERPLLFRTWSGGPYRLTTTTTYLVLNQRFCFLV